MFKPVPMAKVAIVGPKPKLADTVETLHRLRLMHIEDFDGQDEFFDLGTPLPQGSKIAERLLRIRGVMKGADMTPPPGARPFTLTNLTALEDKLREVEDELARLVEERGTLQDQVKALDELAATLRRVQNLPFPTRLLSGYASLAVASGFIPDEADLALFQKLHADTEWIESHEEEGRFIAVFAPKAAEKDLAEAAARIGLEPLEVPASDQTPRARLAEIDAQRAQLGEQLAGLTDKITTIRDRHAAAFFALDEHLGIESDKATSPVRFWAGPNSFIIEGWIPHDSYAKMESNLLRATQNGVYVTRITRAARSMDAPAHHAAKDEHATDRGEDAHRVDDVPVMLRNPKRSGPYELLTDTYARPKYTELDPTLFMYVGFPIFFGLMLGDIGYGLVLLVMLATGAFNFLYKLVGFESKWHLNRIFLHCAVSSVIFGALYSEFFGLELFGHNGVVGHYETHFGFIPYPLSRLENVKLLLALSLLIGVVHLFVGLVLGMRNAAAQHGMGAAIKHRGSWLCILTAVALAGFAVVPTTLGLGAAEPHEPAEGEAVVPVEAAPAHYSPLLLYSALAFFIVGVVLLVMGEGGIALLELPSIVSNLLSYTRLVAIGLSGVGIALAGNEIAKLAMTGGWAGIALAILVLFLFHTLGVILGIIGPALHSLRLHYVEFFTKFYEGGGTIFTPFGAQRKYTIQEVKQA
ncbi:MAG TPA: V-type ATP synthase subunit I [Candidatus Thermoplasmatota archaeon]|nr:V-type ATP synthase subunit I [Candidatus Thermoplasmatota archaeon]